MFGLLFDLDRKYKIRIQFNKVSDESFSSVSLIKVGWRCIMKLDYATGFYNMSFFNINHKVIFDYLFKSSYMPV